MVHALRMMQGKYNQIPAGKASSGISFYDDEEEFLAIVATMSIFLRKMQQRPCAAIITIMINCGRR